MANRLETRLTASAQALEQAYGELAPVPYWQLVDLTTYSDSGQTPETVVREVMSAGRDALKGAQVGMSTKFGVTIDNTIDNTLLNMAGFLYNRPIEQPTSRPLLTAGNTAATLITAVTATTVTCPPFGLIAGDLCVLSDGTNDRVLMRYLSSAGNVHTFEPANTVSWTPNTNVPRWARVIKVGVTLTEATLTGFTDRVELVATGSPAQFVGLARGQWLFIGDAASNMTTVQPFFARIDDIDGLKITFDTSTRPVPTAAATINNLTLYIPTFIVNGQEELSMAFSRYLGYDDVAQKEMRENYSGCTASELSINAKEKSLLTLDMSYIGKDLTYDAITKAENQTDYLANTAAVYSQDAINLSTDVVRQRMYVHKGGEMNPAAIHSFVNELNIKITNNVTEDTAMGHLGAVGTSAGTFGVSGSATVFFNSLTALQAARCNCTVGMDMIYARKNAGVVIDIPSLTVSTNGLTLEKGQSIKLPLDQAAFKSKFGFTLSYTAFHYLPNEAMPFEGCDC